jgi:hypothetical protein
MHLQCRALMNVIMEQRCTHMGYDDQRIEMIFVPAKNGYIKVFVYGFSNLGTWGSSIAEFNGVSAAAKGFSKKRTIVRSIAKLHESLVNKGKRRD